MKVISGSARSWAKNYEFSSPRFFNCFPSDKFVSWNFNKGRPISINFCDFTIRSYIFSKLQYIRTKP